MEVKIKVVSQYRYARNGKSTCDKDEIFIIDLYKKLEKLKDAEIEEIMKSYDMSIFDSHVVNIATITQMALRDYYLFKQWILMHSGCANLIYST